MSRRSSSGKRYADILTILLVIVIIGIIILLGYFGYKAVKKNSVESDNSQAVEEFKKNVAATDDDETNTDGDNTVENTDSNSSEGFSSLIDTTTNSTQTSNTSSGSTSTSTTEKTKTYLAGYEVKGTIYIPKTGIEYAILEKVTVGSLSAAVAILDIATCDEITSTVTELNVPGTNALILGHNYRNGQFFSDNDKLELGDVIKITDTSGETVTYTIYKMYYTTSDDISFLERELDANTREITLQTCNDDSSQRLIIWAKDS